MNHNVRVICTGQRTPQSPVLQLLKSVHINALVNTVILKVKNDLLNADYFFTL